MINERREYYNFLNYVQSLFDNFNKNIFNLLKQNKGQLESKYKQAWLITIRINKVIKNITFGIVSTYVLKMKNRNKLL